MKVYLLMDGEQFDEVAPSNTWVQSSRQREVVAKKSEKGLYSVLATAGMARLKLIKDNQQHFPNNKDQAIQEPCAGTTDLLLLILESEGMNVCCRPSMALQTFSNQSFK